MTLGKTIIRVTCIDQRLVISSGPVIASGGLNEDKIVFDFCPLWNDFVKTAIFYRDKGEVYHSVLVDDTCLIPWEVTASEGEMYFGVFGVKGDATRTSEILRYKVVAGAITEGAEPSDPTPEIYAQLLDVAQRATEALNNHVSNSAATTTQFGHVKLMASMFEMVEGSGGFKTPDGEIISYDDLKGYAASAWLFCVLNEILNAEFVDIDNQLQMFGESISFVRKKVMTLEESMAALTDAEGVEF